MKIRTIINMLYFISLSIIWVACSNEEPVSEKQQLIDEIDVYEKGDSAFSKSAANTRVGLYKSFVEQYPQDSLSPFYLRKAAQSYQMLGGFKESVEAFKMLVEKYPDHPISEQAAFGIGYIYENNLREFGNAHEAYQDFMKKYPDSKLVESAEFSIANMGKTPEQLFKQFNLDSAEIDAAETDTMTAVQ